MAEPRRWRRPPRIRRRTTRFAVFAGCAIYAAIAFATFDVDVERVREGLERGARFVSGFLSPDFTTRGSDVLAGFLESLAITIVATAIGLVVSIPIGVGAAKNVAPTPVYWVCRAIVVVARGFHELIVALLFVVMVGFGPLAGVLTLVVAGVGFVAKLLAEAIESIDPAPVEAVRSTGAGPLHVLVFAVLPQVKPRWVGLSVYRFDINFRESAIIGVVGAGGIGATLNTAFKSYDYDTAAAILIVIVVLVAIGEVVSGRIRKRWV